MKLAVILVASAIAAQAADPVPFWRDASKKTGFKNSVVNAIKRHSLNHPLAPPVNGRRSGDLVNDNNELYTTTATIGMQQFWFDLDTGSSDVWVRGLTCISSDGSCGSSDQLAFDITDSSVYDTGNNFSTSYGSGSVSGEVYSGPVSLAGVSAGFLNFGVSTSETGFNSPADGLWGLSYAALNEIAPGSDDGNFIASAGINSLAFYFSNSADGDCGELTVNDVDPSKYSGSIEYIPITSDTYYEFDPSDCVFTVNGIDNACTDGSNGAIADTGTTLLLVPNDLADAINSAIGTEPYDSSNGVYFVDCGVASSGPVLNFTLGPVAISINPAEYVMSWGSFCASGITQIGNLTEFGPAYIFGDVFLRAAYTVFDIQNNQLGFAQAVHDFGWATVQLRKEIVPQDQKTILGSSNLESALGYKPDAPTTVAIAQQNVDLRTEVTQLRQGTAASSNETNIEANAPMAAKLYETIQAVPHFDNVLAAVNQENATFRAQAEQYKLEIVTLKAQLTLRKPPASYQHSLAK
ncbi:1,3-beta-glucanosyltransferase [Physocladia obscura]|uniref:1,3-beta-glucanosyltransferase n=1 Tax=Physocladia obscura TaxID=109957 RepID=A0AAD5T8U3_9FUNG|nr:1,3-beta-glucanosyltransferase [Physocladia obscura]